MACGGGRGGGGCCRCRRCDLLIVMGTSLVVHPFASLICERGTAPKPRSCAVHQPDGCLTISAPATAGRGGCGAGADYVGQWVPRLLVNREVAGEATIYGESHTRHTLVHARGGCTRVPVFSATHTACQGWARVIPASRKQRERKRERERERTACGLPAQPLLFRPACPGLARVVVDRSPASSAAAPPSCPQT